MGSFYAIVSRRAFLYTRRRFINALNLSASFIVIYFAWTLSAPVLSYIWKEMKDELKLGTPPKRSVSKENSSSEEKVKND